MNFFIKIKDVLRRWLVFLAFLGFWNVKERQFRSQNWNKKHEQIGFSIFIHDSIRFCENSTWFVIPGKCPIKNSYCVFSLVAIFSDLLKGSKSWFKHVSWYLVPGMWRDLCPKFKNKSVFLINYNKIILEKILPDS